MTGDFQKDIGAKELRKFGLSTGAIVGLLFGGIIPWIWNLNYPTWPWIVFAVLGVWGLIAPLTLRAVYRTWMRFGLLISKITTPIILGVVFYLVVMPIGLIMRIFRQDPMARGFESDVKTYRIDMRDQPKDYLENPY